MLDEVLKKVEETQKKLEELGFQKFPITTTVEKLKPGVAGVARTSARLIAISEDYLREHPDHTLNITTPHEICHLYVSKYFPRAKQKHGPEFRHLMRLLGLQGDTYHSLGRLGGTQKRQTYDYKCDCTTHKVSSIIHKRILNGQTRHCLKCKQNLEEV